MFQRRFSDSNNLIIDRFSINIDRSKLNKKIMGWNIAFRDISVPFPSHKK